jgi:hypothetical protein
MRGWVGGRGGTSSCCGGCCCSCCGGGVRGPAGSRRYCWPWALVGRVLGLLMLPPRMGT